MLWMLVIFGRSDAAPALRDGQELRGVLAHEARFVFALWPRHLSVPDRWPRTCHHILRTLRLDVIRTNENDFSRVPILLYFEITCAS